MEALIRLGAVVGLLCILSMGYANAGESIQDVFAAASIPGDNGALSIFSLEIPSGDIAQRISKWELQLRFKAVANCFEAFIEVQVCEHRQGTMVLPLNKVRPISKLIESSGESTVTLDIYPLLAEYMDETGASISLAVGSISEDSCGSVEVMPLNPETALWARAIYHVQE